MKFELSSDIKHLLILGAGASVDYGLPTWEKLGALIEEKVNNDGERFEHRKEILSWLSKIGENKEYDTIDRCITKESRSKEYRSNGLTIEDQIFSATKDIFKELYKEYDDGWVNKLNQKILDTSHLEHQIAFLNYNYDNVLDENLLHFDYLTQKERDVDYRIRRGNLSSKYIPAFYPHGNFFSEDELRRPSHLYKRIDTNKSELGNVIDAISCYESKIHEIKKYGNNPIKLYILGLGGGLRINLDHINLEHPVFEIHVTIKDESKKDEIIKFLNEKYGIPTTQIKIYRTCDELIENSFGN